MVIFYVDVTVELAQEEQHPYICKLLKLELSFRVLLNRIQKSHLTKTDFPNMAFLLVLGNS